jgi:hypothetical protein
VSLTPVVQLELQIHKSIHKFLEKIFNDTIGMIKGLGDDPLKKPEVKKTCDTIPVNHRWRLNNKYQQQIPPLLHHLTFDLFIFIHII